MVSFPNAKINLGLRVISKRPDGLHNIETAFYPVELCDALDVVEAPVFKFTISGLEIGGSTINNIIVKAYQLLKKDFGLPPVQIHLHKVIPSGAGLGGGSSDGAFMLKTLNTLFNMRLEAGQLERYASFLGADSPFFIQNTPSLATGTGTSLTPINIRLSGYSVVIVKPQVSVNTASAYRRIVLSKRSHPLTEILNLPVNKWRGILKNDFEEPLFKLYPEIQNIKDLLYKTGAVYAAMSGSGSAVFGLFRSLPIKLDELIPNDYFIYR